MAETTVVRVDQEQYDALVSIRDADGVPVAEQVRRAIAAWLKSRGVALKPKRGRK